MSHGKREGGWEADTQQEIAGGSVWGIKPVVSPREFAQRRRPCLFQRYVTAEPSRRKAGLPWCWQEERNTSSCLKPAAASRLLLTLWSWRCFPSSPSVWADRTGGQAGMAKAEGLPASPNSHRSAPVSHSCDRKPCCHSQTSVPLLWKSGGFQSTPNGLRTWRNKRWNSTEISWTASNLIWSSSKQLDLIGIPWNLKYPMLSWIFLTY